jgi:hypothetical protein
MKFSWLSTPSSGKRSTANSASTVKFGNPGAMNSESLRRIHFQSPEYLVERLDAIAEIFDTDRTALLVEAIREYTEETAGSTTFQQLVATKYYDDELEFDAVKQLVGAETAQRLRLLKSDLEDEPLDIQAPDDVDIYEGDAESIAPDASKFDK